MVACVLRLLRRELVNGVVTMSQVFATLSNQIEVQPLSGSLGAEVLGVDLAQLDDGAFDAIYSAFVQHQVVVFREIGRAHV